MYTQDPYSQVVKIVYYTHPLCPVSWAMQADWQRFVGTFGPYISTQFCMAGNASDPAQSPEKGAFPAYVTCLAVKAAGLQSSVAADLYLGRLRKAAMAEQRDILQPSVLAELAREISKYYRGEFDFHRFGKDFDTRATRQALHADVQKAYCNRIDRFPTLTLTVAGKGIKIAGQATYEKLVTAIRKLLTGADLRPPVF
nr:DsbA family protein [uncultured Dyadobacter sp.]